MVGRVIVRILILSTELSPRLGTGGIGTYVESAATTLASLGHTVHVLSCARGLSPSDTDRGGWWAHERPLIRLRGLGRVIKNPALQDRILTIVSCWSEGRKFLAGVDVVEFPDWMGEGLLFTLHNRLSRKQCVATVAHLHTPFKVIQRYADPIATPSLSDRISDALERWAVKYADGVVSPSQLLVTELRDLGWLHPGLQVHVVRHPLDTAAWSTVSPVISTGPIVLAIGRIEARKAPEAVLAATEMASALHSIPITLCLVGRSSGERDGLPYLEWLKQQQDPDAAVHLRHLAEVSHDQMPAILSEARLVVTMSRFDNFPVAALEAMAAKRPLIVSDSVGTSEIMSRISGTICASDDVALLADAIARYVTDPAASQSAGEAGWKQVVDHCSPLLTSQARLDIYQGVIDLRARRRASSYSIRNRKPAMQKRK